MMREVLARWWVGIVSGAVAAGLRLATFLPGFSLRRVLSYDDSAYFAGAQMFVEGHFPYRTFPFLQPPGTVLVASPFALVGRLLGGDIGLASLRVAIIVMAAATCVLIADLLRPYGVVASLGGSLLYASQGVVVLASRTFYLESFLAFAVIWTFWLLRRDGDGRRRYFLIGLVLGVACGVKTWAGVDVAVFAVLIGVTRGRRKMSAWFGGVITAILVIWLPFFVAAPRTMWHQVALAQLERSTLQPVADRVAAFNGFVGFPGVSFVLSPGWAQLVVGGGLAVASSPLIAQLLRRRSLRDWNPTAWWSALALAEVATLLCAPTFFQHYWAWPAGSLALSIGAVLGALDRKWSRVPLLVGIGLVSISMGYSVLRFRTFQVVAPTAAVRTFAASHDCTYFDLVEVQAQAGGAGVAMYAPCRKWPDPIGAELAFGHEGRHDPLFAVAHDPRWQRALREQLDAADSAVLCRTLASEPFDDTTVRLFRERFAVVSGRSTRAMTCRLWELRRPADD